MSVLKAKRKASQFEVYHHVIAKDKFLQSYVCVKCPFK